MPLVSICIPTYYQTEYLRKTLNSIKEQRFDDYELVITDDTKDDSVLEVVETFKFGSKLRYFRNPISLGSPENWNESVRNANGFYIKILHHDDRFTRSDALDSFVQMLHENPKCDFAFSATLVHDVMNNNNYLSFPSETQLNKLSIAPEELFLGNIIGAPSAVIYRNGLEVEFDKRMKWLVDLDFYIRILQKNGNFYYTENALVSTTSNAPHQVTNMCKNNASVELEEYLLLYAKIADKPNIDSEIREKWYSLFKQYRISSLEDLDDIGIDRKLSESHLARMLADYRNTRFSRFLRSYLVRTRSLINRMIA